MHVTHRKFGTPLRGWYNEIKQLHNAGKPIRNVIALKVIMSQAYDVTYGIYNHNAPNAHPFATSLLHPAEQLDYQSPLQLRLKEFRSRRVYELTGLDFDKFLNRPRDEVETILTECGVQNATDLASNEAAEKLAQGLSGQGK
jgi:hypothetical protein